MLTVPQTVVLPLHQYLHLFSLILSMFEMMTIMTQPNQIFNFIIFPIAIFMMNEKDSKIFNAATHYSYISAIATMYE